MNVSGTVFGSLLGRLTSRDRDGRPSVARYSQPSRRRSLRWRLHDLAVRLGYEVRAWPHPATYEAALRAVLRARRINCVLDVGANRGSSVCSCGG